MIGVVIGVCFVSGVIAGMIAANRGGSGGAFFVLGALFPVIGIVAACFVKPEPQAGWFADPWQQAAVRYFDGNAWTGHTG